MFSEKPLALTGLFEICFIVYSLKFRITAITCAILILFEKSFQFISCPTLEFPERTNVIIWNFPTSGAADFIVINYATSSLCTTKFGTIPQEDLVDSDVICHSDETWKG